MKKTLKKFLRHCRDAGVVDIKIGPRIYGIAQPKAARKILSDQVDEIDGLCDSSGSIIVLSPAVRSEGHLKLVLMHEIIHAMNDTFGFEWAIKNSEYEYRSDAEEYLAWFFASAILEFIRDNPELVSVLSRDKVLAS